MALRTIRTKTFSTYNGLKTSRRRVRIFLRRTMILSLSEMYTFFSYRWPHDPKPIIVIGNLHNFYLVMILSSTIINFINKFPKKIIFTANRTRKTLVPFY